MVGGGRITILGEWILNAWVRISSESFAAGFRSAASPMSYMALKMTSHGKVLKMTMMMMTVTVKKIMERSKVRMRTLSNNLSFQKLL
jgi:hypothetical protein